jgi:endonuclease YncB( thermonuclease family)
MPSPAGALLRLVIGIADEDTLTARCETPAAMQNLRARFAEIDAPEKGQAFGNRAHQHLAEVCFKMQAVVKPQPMNRYGRNVARIECDGGDVNAEQVRAGVAWVFDRYVIDRSLYALQDEVKAAMRGLWADNHPLPPWEWHTDARARGGLHPQSRAKSAPLTTSFAP